MAPEIEGANFLSGKSIRASCGLKAPAMRERRRVSLLEFLFNAAKDGNVDVGMKDSSRKLERYCDRLEEISERV